jgi:hypothetical protein
MRREKERKKHAWVGECLIRVGTLSTKVAAWGWSGRKIGREGGVGDRGQRVGGKEELWYKHPRKRKDKYLATETNTGEGGENQTTTNTQKKKEKNPKRRDI